MIYLCAPTDEAGRDFDEQIESLLRNKIYLAEIRGIIGKNVLDLNDEEAAFCLNKLKNNSINVWSISSPIGKWDFAIPIEKFRERVNRAIHVCEQFECNNLRVFSFFDHHNDVCEIVKRLGYAVEQGKKHDINICLENEKDSYAQTTETTLELLNKIPGLKYIYDSSNFIQVGESSDKTLNEVFPYAYFVHFKDGIFTGKDADITPVGKGEANINKMLSLINKDIVLSLEHHLKFTTENISYESIKDDCEYVYKNIVEAFDDSCKNARLMLKNAGYKEIAEGKFNK